jgi:hypothetical protein
MTNDEGMTKQPIAIAESAENIGSIWACNASTPIDFIS